jgi:UDP-glucose:(heptosyl)LPS alpha-1,3-glucosyltransferase
VSGASAADDADDIATAAPRARAEVRRIGREPRLAFGIVSLFPSGGLQRDCIAVAESLQKRGHSVTIFTSRIRGGVTADVPIVVLPVKSLTNHGRNAGFARALADTTAGKFDLVVGFDKLPSLDVLYCADPSIRESVSRVAQLVWPRYRGFARLEGACFRQGASTRLILLSPDQANAYRRVWQTEPERITVIAPLADRTRRRPELRQADSRARLRRALGIHGDELVLLSIGGHPNTKGFDRAIRALPALRSARLVIAGINVTSPSWRSLLRLAEKLGVDSRLIATGIREDIPELMAAADILVHLARRETTGTVILEAIVNGLPVIATGTCGFSPHVRTAAAGLVLPEPYDERDFVAAVRQAEDAPLRSAWSADGVQYGERQDLYSGIHEAVMVIERACHDGLRQGLAAPV